MTAPDPPAVTCERCKGTGFWETGPHSGECSDCRGTGKVRTPETPPPDRIPEPSEADPAAEVCRLLLYDFPDLPELLGGGHSQRAARRLLSLARTALTGRQPPPALPLSHGRNCPGSVAASDEDCTCGLFWRQRIAALESAIRTHRDQKADDRCIEDDDRLYAALGDGVPCDRRVGDKAAMLKNCERFIERRCEGGGWLTYADLEQRALAAEADAGRLLATLKGLKVETDPYVQRALGLERCDSVRFALAGR